MCDWLTATEAAAYLKVKPRTILQWAKEGRLKGYRLSGTALVTWRFLRSDLDANLSFAIAPTFRKTSMLERP